jgi:hypothetical protein
VVRVHPTVPTHWSGRAGRRTGARTRLRMDVSDQRQVTELLAQLAAISAVLRAIANSPHALQPIRHDP